jgi:trans-2,3-dihydro-3-hydroxyanthranilate isomerase
MKRLRASGTRPTVTKRSTRVYHLVNVFTRDGGNFTGNPLCVFEDGTGLSAPEMQALALQFNLSESTFILPPAAGGRAAARVRIFTPGEELPFAGHPTLGTAHVLRRLRGGDEMAIELAAGLVPVEATGDCWTLTAPPATHRPVDESAADLAAAVGLHAADLADGASGALWVSTGTEQLLMPLRSVDAVLRAVADPLRITRMRSRQDNSMVGIFHDDGRLVTLRFFFRNGLGVAEDPATGSACANLGGWFMAMGQVPITRIVQQGDQIRRPSTLRLDVGADCQIRVSGDVLYLGQGWVQL